MDAICRDCLHQHQAQTRCPACRSPRCVSHPELLSLGVAHLDCDSFYASVEKRDDPRLADRAVIVGGGRRGVVSAACYVARIAGVRSAMPMFKALALCPDAVVIRPRMEAYVAVSRRIKALMRELTPLVEPLSLDEAFLDLRGADRLHGGPPALTLLKLLGRIEAEIGVSASVGLSHNKFLAKMASDLDKPRGFSVIGAAETEDFLADKPVSMIWGAGAALQAKLRGDGLNTFADLRAAPAEALFARYGAMGKRLSELSRGRDLRPISSGGAMKSVSAETTFEEDIANREALEAHLWRLAVRVADRAKAKEIGGRVVILKLKTTGFRVLTRQTALGSRTQLADRIFTTGRDLLALLTAHGPFRLIGVGLGDLGPETGGAEDDGAANTLFDPRAGARARAERATDRIRSRYGSDAIGKGRGLR